VARVRRPTCEWSRSSSRSLCTRHSDASEIVGPSTPVEYLGEAIANLAARIHAATYELLVMLRQFDEGNGWTNGFMSCAHWLHWRTGIDLGAAREKVRVAKALAQLPLLGGALQRGEISYAKVRALTRVATPENEARLLAVAYEGTAAQVERLARAWRRCDHIQEGRDRERAHLGRSVTTYVDEDGMVVLRARLPPELGAVVQRALEAASERLYQRRADALALLAEAALEGRLDRGTTADRYQVVMHVEGQASEPLEQGVLELADGGIHVSGCTARRCDAHHIEHWVDGGATALDNLVLVCRRHHRLVHEGGYGVELVGGEATFIRPDGRRIAMAPLLSSDGALVVDGRVGSRSLRCWDGTRLDVGYAIDVLWSQYLERASGA
jgi:hypothetical protein